MKIGTDSVLLGSAMVLDDSVKNILDIGTGTGLLALMIAQKSKALIDAIEIDEEAYKQAAVNFQSSKWSERLEAHLCSLQNFKTSKQLIYDLIICNPPFYRFNQNILIDNEARSMARHDKELPFKDLAYHVKRLLTLNGHFWLILPMKEADEFIKIAGAQNLFISSKLLVQPKPSKASNRMILCFKKTEEPFGEKHLCIYNELGEPTQAYYEATKDYLLWKNVN